MSCRVQLKTSPTLGRLFIKRWWLVSSTYLERMAGAHKRFKGMSLLDTVHSNRGLLLDIQTDGGEACMFWAPP